MFRRKREKEAKRQLSQILKARYQALFKELEGLMEELRAKPENQDPQTNDEWVNAHKALVVRRRALDREFHLLSELGILSYDEDWPLLKEDICQ